MGRIHRGHRSKKFTPNQPEEKGKKKKERKKGSFRQ